MFHVEHHGCEAQLGEAVGSLGACDQNLRAIVSQAPQNQLLVRPVQLRGQVVQGDDRPIAAGLRLMFCLGQQRRQCGQLGLATGQGFAARNPGVIDALVGAVRTHRCEPGGQVPIAGQQQGISQRQLLPAPARHEAQHGLPALGQQGTAGGAQEHL